MRDRSDEERSAGDNTMPVARASEVLAELLQRPLAPGLYLVATPIGNLGDISLRALSVLARADLIAAEDTRHSKKLLSHFGLRGKPTPYHEHNAEAARPKLIARIAAGEAVALVSDAGTPLISDPGYRLVYAAREAGLPVTALPGASSVLAALVSAGLPTDRFFFEGFLPPKSGARRARIAELAHMPATLILFETGPRIAAALSECGGNRSSAARRLGIKRSTLGDRIQRCGLPPRGLSATT